MSIIGCTVPRRDCSKAKTWSQNGSIQNRHWRRQVNKSNNQWSNALQDGDKLHFASSILHENDGAQMYGGLAGGPEPIVKGKSQQTHWRFHKRGKWRKGAQLPCLFPSDMTKKNVKTSVASWFERRRISDDQMTIRAHNCLVGSDTSPGAMVLYNATDRVH